MTSQRCVERTEAVPVEHGEGIDVATRIVTAVADREGVDPTALDTRLYDVVDPDALASLVEDAPESGLTVGFDYEGYRVSVVADEDVHVEVVPKQ